MSYSSIRLPHNKTYLQFSFISSTCQLEMLLHPLLMTILGSMHFLSLANLPHHGRTTPQFSLWSLQTSTRLCAYFESLMTDLDRRSVCTSYMTIQIHLLELEVLHRHPMSTSTLRFSSLRTITLDNPCAIDGDLIVEGIMVLWRHNIKYSTHSNQNAPYYIRLQARRQCAICPYKAPFNRFSYLVI